VFQAKAWTCQDVPQYFDHHTVGFSELHFESTIQVNGGKLTKFSLRDKLLLISTGKQGRESSNLSDRVSFQSDLSIFQGHISINIPFTNN
jgi:hypothetical protein